MDELPMNVSMSTGYTLNLGRQMVEAAGQACSPDNNQPWAFRVQLEGIDVFHHRGRAVPSDVDGLFAGIAMGAALENLAIKATELGLEAQIEFSPQLFEKGEQLEPVARVRFTPCSTSDPLAPYLAARTTNRRNYRRKLVKTPAVEAMTEAARLRGADIAWLRERSSMRRLARLIMAADRIRFEDQKFHDEMHQMLRFSPAQCDETGDGLDVASLEIPRFTWPLLRFLRPWPRMQAGNYLGLSRLFTGPSMLQVLCCGGVGLLLVPRRDARGYIDAGRAFQRLWIAAAASGLAFHPLGALPLFLLRLELLGSDAFSMRHARRVEAIREPFLQLFPEARQQLAVILFRVGYAKPPSARARRYPVDQILLD